MSKAKGKKNESGPAEAGAMSLPDGVVVRLRNIREYVPDPHNANRGTERGLYMIERSVGEVGLARSIVAASDDTVPAGNKTLESAAEAGFEDVIEVETDGTQLVVVKRRDWQSVDDEQARLYAYYDNRSSEVGLDWDDEQIVEDLRAGVDLSGLWLPDELDELVGDWAEEAREAPEDAGPVEARGAELIAKWGVQAGQVWAIPSVMVPGKAHRLICGDATSAATVARLMNGREADCVFTSPPYAVGIDYGEYEDTLENLREMLPKLSRLWLDAVAEGGYAVVNFNDIAAGREAADSDDPCEYPMALEYWPVFRADGWLLWSRRIWCKPTPRVHSPWCIQSNRAASDFEHVWTWRKPGPPLVKRVDGEFTSVKGWIDTSHEVSDVADKSEHGAGMPTNIARHMLMVHSRAGGIVLEPFCGSGTTVVAAEQTGRVCYASEIGPGYVAGTLERLSLMGLEPALVEGADG